MIVSTGRQGWYRSKLVDSYRGIRTAYDRANPLPEASLAFLSLYLAYGSLGTFNLSKAFLTFLGPLLALVVTTFYKL